MTGRLLALLARALRPGEREYVLGDLAESGAAEWRAVGQVAGLVLRRQAEHWKHAGPWVALVGIVGVSGFAIAGLGATLFTYGGMYSRAWWKYGVRYHTGLTVCEDAAVFAALAGAALVWAWMAGFAIGRFSDKAFWFTGGLLVIEWGAMGWGVVLLPALWCGMRRARSPGWPWAGALACVAMAGMVLWAADLRADGFERWSQGEWRISRHWPTQLLGAGMACWPAFYVLAMSRRREAMRTAMLAMGLCVMAGGAGAAEGVKTALIEADARKAAPDFAIPDATGRIVKLSALRGKVVLVNFWATYCGGCKVEIPWFQEFETAWGKKGFAVVGLSLDEGGWKDVAPYVAKTGVRYQMLIADKAVLDKYSFEAMPATYLVDRNGRIAARYIGLVDRADIQGKIAELMRVR